MNDIVNEYNVNGLIVGLLTFLMIGIFHPLVIKGEYYFGVKVWWAFLIGGIFGVLMSLYCEDLVSSILWGVFAFSCFWSILEVFEQRKRVAKGWFPKREKKEEK